MRKQLLAYLLVAAVAAYGAYQSTNAQQEAASAQKTARAVDLDGDRSLCESENRIRTRTNRRDEALEETAKLVKEALRVLATDDVGDDARLRAIARKAEKIRTEFAPEKISDCEKRFPEEK